MRRSCAPQPHIVIPPDQWPRGKVWCFCPDCRDVFGIEKADAPVCPACGREGLRDIFSEMAERMQRTWTFFEATRHEEGRWLFRHSPGDEEYSLWGTLMALGYYGEVRALGFEPPWIDDEEEVLNQWIGEINAHLNPETNLLKGPDHGSCNPGDWGYLSHSYDWQLRNRVFMADRYRLPVGGLHGKDPLATKAMAIEAFNAKLWDTNAYAACNLMGKEMKSHREFLRAAGEDENDEIMQMLHEKIDAQFVDGHWGAAEGASPDGNMKMLVDYSRLDWPIPDHKKLIDYTLGFATEEAGFEGRGCRSFNQMSCLVEARRQFPDGYRADEIDRHTAKTFVNWLDNWDETLHFYGDNWSAKSNNGVATHMPALMLDLPIHRSSVIYNWREGPIITRDADGTIMRGEVIYHTKGFEFHG